MSSSRFTRDDEQLLALNYENLCDGDYLNRLFTDNVTGSSSSDKEGSYAEVTTPSSSAQETSFHPDSAIFSSDLAEDLIIFGKSPDLGRLIFDRRFHHELSTHNFSKTQDSATNLILRQAVVFDYIGKLMLERCTSSEIRTFLSVKNNTK